MNELIKIIDRVNHHLFQIKSIGIFTTIYIFTIFITIFTFCFYSFDY